MILTHLVLFSFLGGASVADAPAVAAETVTGGWAARKHAPFRGETDTEREARIKAERVRLGIIEPDPTAEAATLVSPWIVDSEEVDSAIHYPLFTAEELAQAYTSAYLDAEISRHFRILEDEDDAAVLLLAIATLH